MNKVLFLCSANYYRSRFAEHFFNHLAKQQGLSWRADSRGLIAGHWGNIGPISKFAVEGLASRGIDLGVEHREPKPLTLSDLSNADLVIAVKEAEHRPMVAEQFPLWEDSVEYWHIDDLDCATRRSVARSGRAYPGIGDEAAGVAIGGRAVSAMCLAFFVAGLLRPPRQRLQ